MVHSKVSLKLAMRLPPTANTKEVMDYMSKELSRNPPYNAKVTCKPVGFNGNGWCANKLNGNLKNILEEASNDYFGNPPRYMGVGGSIPLITDL